MPAQYDLPPWIDSLTVEYAVKLLLYGIFGNTAPSGGGGGIPVTPGTGTQRTPTCTAAVVSGSTTVGVTRVTFVASSDFSGTVLGQAFAAGASLTFPTAPGDTLGAMAFTRSAGTLFIYYVT